MNLSKLALGAFLIASSLTISTAQAATPGFYLGAQAGMGKANEGDDFRNNFKATLSNYSINEGGFAGRLFLGYNFSRYFGLESGYTALTNNTYKTTIAGTERNLSFKTAAWDISAKGYLPLDVMTDTLSENLNIYGKLGLAYVTHKYDAKQAIPPLNIAQNTDSKNSIHPTAAVGFGYSFTENFMADLSWTYIQGKGNLRTLSSDFRDFSPQINTLALGVSYTFT